MERHILREGTSSCPISSSGSLGVPTLAPPCNPYRQRRPNASDQLRVHGSTLDSDWTLSQNLTGMFFYHVVPFRLYTCLTSLPWRTAICPFTNHNMTTYQSTQGHQERTQIPCQQSLHNNFFMSCKEQLRLSLVVPAFQMGKDVYKRKFNIWMTFFDEHFFEGRSNSCSTVTLLSGFPLKNWPCVISCPSRGVGK